MLADEVSSPFLDTWKDWQPAVRLLQRDEDTLKWEPATGLLGITFRVSATEQGNAIGALTNIPTSEAAGPDGDGGFYVGSIDLAVLTSELPELTYPQDTDVFLQVVKPGDIVVEAIKKTIRRRKY
jgi:hypothetical protein